MKTPRIHLTHDHALIFFFAVRETYHTAASAEGALGRIGYKVQPVCHELLSEKHDALLCLAKAARFDLHAPGF